jgi:hypothetical protein
MQDPKQFVLVADVSNPVDLTVSLTPRAAKQPPGPPTPSDELTDTALAGT